MIFADKFKLDEVLRNLISNALKFSPRNSRISVRMGFRPLVNKASTKRGIPMLMAQSASRRERRGSVNHAVTTLSRHTTGFLRGIQTRLLAHQQRKVGDDGADPHCNTTDPKGTDDDIEAAAGGKRRSFLPGISNHHQRRLSSGHSPNNGHASNSVDTSRGNVVKGELIVVVTDIGAGISKENQKLLFQEGMQFDPEKLQTGGGSGFGLSISKSIVELHGGHMEVFSEGEGKGCSFLYRIPMKRQPPELADASEQVLNAGRATLRKGGSSGNHFTQRQRRAQTLRIARGVSGTGTELGGGGGGGGVVSDQKVDHILPTPVSQSQSDSVPFLSESRRLASTKVFPSPPPTLFRMLSLSVLIQ